MKIRQITEKDKKLLLRLMQEVGYDKPIAEKRSMTWANGRNKIMLVLEERGELIGYVGFKKNDSDESVKSFLDHSEDYAHLNWTGIDPTKRRKGFGSMLVRKCDSLAKEWGKKGIWLDCREWPITFYEHNGYFVIGSYEDNGKPRFVMVKDTH